MPRIARAVARGFPHHVVQRGNNKEKVFLDEEDKQKYLSLLRKYTERWNCPVLAYCLMDNHVHLLTRPKTEESLSKMMQGITLCYTQYRNRKYKRTGRLWESRYYSCIVDAEEYLWAVARYIEQNPVRAKVVKKAEGYEYSSAAAHVGGMRNNVLGEELFEERQRKNYKEFLREGMPAEETKSIRYALKTGRPLGGEGFLIKMEKSLKKTFQIRSPGRPRKQQKGSKIN
jgi:putative transposase